MSRYSLRSRTEVFLRKVSEEVVEPARRKPEAGGATDFTGYWVSVVVEDWRYRMLDPNKGDFGALPLTADARKIAATWDPAKDPAPSQDCRNYGAVNLMRQPGRIHITWQDDQTLKLESDAGSQTRMLAFGSARRAGGRLARSLASILGLNSRGPRRRTAYRVAENRHHEAQTRISPQKRSAVQREYGSHGILRPHRRNGRQLIPRGNNNRRRYGQSNRPLSHFSPLSKAG